MSKYCRDVQLFQNKFGFAVPSDFTLIARDLFDFRVKFLYEEFHEYRDAVDVGDLGTAIDSLIDLVYVTCGTAIFHGIGYDTFDEILSLPAAEKLFSSKATQTGVPHFLDPHDHARLCSLIEAAIIDYIDGYTEKNEKRIKSSLAAIYLDCLFASTAMDLTNEQWDELWVDVQRANMAKERAKKASDSKRGSTYDIIKPLGWEPPRTNELIQKYLNGK